MPLLSWCSRRVGGLSLLALVILCGFVLFNERPSFKVGQVNATRNKETEGIFVLIFASYSFFIHFLVTMFPFRACWAVWDITRSLKHVLRSKKLREPCPKRKLSTHSLSSAETVTASRPSVASSDTEDFDSGYFADVEPEVTQQFHAILIPNYNEDLDVLRETLDVLACHPQARAEYDVSYSILSYGR
jgi:hypothetical protein